jgi:hypothetical protein
MGIRTSPYIAKMVHAHNAKDDNRKVVRFPGIQEPPSHYGLLMIRVRSRLRLVAILFGDLFRRAGAGWIGRGSDVLERCRYARSCDTLCRDHAARVDDLRRSRRLPGQP